jgi:hypothetical protein
MEGNLAVTGSGSRSYIVQSHFDETRLQWEGIYSGFEIMSSYLGK